MASQKVPTVEASLVAGALWVGSYPMGSAWLRYRFDVLVLAAKEAQPPARLFLGMRVIYAPLDDSGEPMTDKEVRTAIWAAVRVRELLDAGKRVLVTCWQGRNRSALIAALALMLPPMPKRGRISRTPSCFLSTHAIAALRMARGPAALSNPWFLQMLERHNGVCGARADLPGLM
jgi:hypothetical protein